MSEIPVIDITPAREGGMEGKKQVAAEIDKALSDTGFMTIIGHGIEHSVFENLNNDLTTFFDMTEPQKKCCSTEDRPCPHQLNGYSALMSENSNAFMGRKNLPSDPVEKFSMGSALLDDDYPLPFPSSKPLEDFRKHAKDYYLACLEVGDMLTELMAIAVGLPLDFFADKINGASDYLRMQRYPAMCKNFDNDEGISSHTDIVLFAIVSSSVAGLEVKTADGQWIRPQSVNRDEFIVNIGDLAQRWSNDVWKSTEHRVVLTEEMRQSVIFFKEVKGDTVIETFSAFGESKYPPITFVDWIKECTDALFGNDNLDHTKDIKEY